MIGTLFYVMLGVVTVMLCGWGFITWISSGEIEPAPYEDFEYRVVEKKRANGTSYFIGESTYEGKVTMLTQSPYLIGRRREEQWSSLGHAPVNRPTPIPVPYELRNVALDRYIAKNGGTDYKYSEFDDPCKVKETICTLRREAAEKYANLSYRKVVSSGECCK